MTPEERKEFVELMADAVKHNQPLARLNFSAIAQGLMLAILIWLGSSFQKGLENDSTFQVILENLQKDVSELQEIAKQPNINRADFKEEIEPITRKLQDIENSQTELKVQARNNKDAIEALKLQLNNRRNF